MVVAGVFALGGVRSAAQRPELKRPGDTPPEKSAEVKKPKKVKGPRAVGLVQLSGSGKATLIPVAILVDGRFFDASAYKADPVPMALESGTVYEAEQAGDSQGLFTVNGALHSKSPANQQPWIGSGTYLPQGAEAPKATRKAEDVPVGLNDNGDEPPRLTRKETSKPAGAPDASSGSGGSGSADKSGAKAPASPPPAGGGSTSSPPGQETPKSAGSAGGDKPTDASTKPAGPPSAGQASPNQAPASQAPPGQASPASTSSTEPAASGQASPPQGSPSSKGSEDSYYRPTLRRGKPTAPAPAEEDDKLAAVTKTGGTVDSKSTVNSGSASPVRIVAAISDGGGPDPQSYKFFWKTGEEDEKRNQMLALAANEVRVYAAALMKNQILAHPVTPKTGSNRRTVPAKQAEPVFENVQFRGFDVWLTNQPVLILSAEAKIPGATGAAAGAEPYSIMLVARTDIYGNLRKLYSGVTDKFHLDVTPRLELIDVVDADGDGRGELLFRETSDAGNGYMIYRATADKLWKMFDSLNADR
jgi:hypothetical protein